MPAAPQENTSPPVYVMTTSSSAFWPLSTKGVIMIAKAMKEMELIPMYGNGYDNNTKQQRPFSALPVVGAVLDNSGERHGMTVPTLYPMNYPFS